MATVRDDARAAYDAWQQARTVRLLCQEVLAAAGVGAGRVAIDFGCGVGVETRAMLTSGWRVLAFDSEPGTRGRVLATTQGSAQERLTIETVHFPDLTALPVADLVYAGYSLPYIHPDDFTRV